MQRQTPPRNPSKTGRDRGALGRRHPPTRDGKRNGRARKDLAATAPKICSVWCACASARSTLPHEGRGTPIQVPLDASQAVPHVRWEAHSKKDISKQFLDASSAGAPGAHTRSHPQGPRACDDEIEGVHAGDELAHQLGVARGAIDRYNVVIRYDLPFAWRVRVPLVDRPLAQHLPHQQRSTRVVALQPKPQGETSLRDDGHNEHVGPLDGHLDVADGHDGVLHGPGLVRDAVHGHDEVANADSLLGRRALVVPSCRAVLVDAVYPHGAALDEVEAEPRAVALQDRQLRDETIQAPLDRQRRPENVRLDVAGAQGTRPTACPHGIPLHLPVLQRRPRRHNQ
mmetsp:Transcript_23187/g.65913  ORF Transcript_23187/g.65913 Transcript_23187/m.65913 type:complete len:341 (+) Transcript_23187:163-1185(+)